MKTFHDGANEERNCVKRRIKRVMMHASLPKDVKAALDELLLWLNQRSLRYKKKIGGL